MKLLVLGASGMIGGGLLRNLALTFSASGTTRTEFEVVGTETAEEISAKLQRVPAFESTDVVINCIGVVKQYSDAVSDTYMTNLNARFPHLLSQACIQTGKKLVHISSDCVFSGKTGGYSEGDLPDATDTYGRSKAEGEQIFNDALVVRTSTIGIEEHSSHGLLMWYLSERSAAIGYRNSIYSGVSLKEFAASLAALIDRRIFSGLYNIASQPISKSDLLSLLSIRGIGCKVKQVPSEPIDRSLNDQKFRLETNIPRPAWRTMVTDIQEELNQHG